MLNINKMIMEAMLTKSPELPVYKEIKGKLVEYTKSKEAIKSPLNDAIELDLIKKLRNEHIETLASLPAGHAQILDEKYFIDTLSTFLPKEASEAEIVEFAQGIVEVGNKKAMGMYIKQVKEKFPSNDGKAIADIVKKLIG